MIINKRVSKIYKFFVFLFLLKFVGILFVKTTVFVEVLFLALVFVGFFIVVSIISSHVISTLSVIFAEYSPFSQVHVEWFQITSFCTYDGFLDFCTHTNINHYLIFDLSNIFLPSNLLSTWKEISRSSVNLFKIYWNDHLVSYFSLMYRYGINTNILHLLFSFADF